VYTDSKTEGSHDWDTFTRFLCAGYAPLHIPEVLYSWRMHEQSTSSNITSKPYVFDSQIAVLEKFIKSQANPNLYLDKSPLFKNSPDWWIRRHHQQPQSMTRIVLQGNDTTKNFSQVEIDSKIPHQTIYLPLYSGWQGLREIIKSLKAPKHLIHLISERVELEFKNEWVWEVMALMEMFPDTVMVGGRTYHENRILSAGYYFGFDWGCGCPDRDQALTDPGYFAQMWKQHSVNAVSSQNSVVDSLFLDRVLEKFDEFPVSLQGLGYWVGAFAKGESKRIIYSPLLTGKTDLDWDDMVSQEEKTTFVCLNYKLFPDTSLLSSHLGLTKETAYQSVVDTHRQNHIDSLKPQYHQLLNAEITLRSNKYPVISDRKPSFSILTTVYIRTNAKLFLETAECLFQQKYGFHEWIILAHGPISADLDSVLDFISPDSRVKILRLPENLGIVGGMRVCLEAASQEYIIPMDADDLLTYDALQIMSWNIVNRGEPDFLYADEDMMIEGIPANPYLRPDWDPILNLASSYIWHLCTFKRDTALQLGVYSDTGANFCHDWDTVFRFSEANTKIVHVTEILYHWRQHTASSTNTQQVDSGSIKSVRYVLEREVSRQANPELYEIVSFPIFRGAEELYIIRRPIAPPPLEVIIISETGNNKSAELKMALQSHNFPFSAIHICGDLIKNNQWEGLLSKINSVKSQQVVVLFDNITPGNNYWSWEALKLFDFHQDLALVGGRLFNREGKIVVGAEIMDDQGNIISPYQGLKSEDPGPYALALKPQTVHFVPSSFFIADTNFVKEALTIKPEVASLKNIGIWLGVIAVQQNKRVAFSPLICGNLTNDQNYFNLNKAMDKQEKLWLQERGKNLFLDECWGASGFYKQEFY
jgi:glycosyltransferase involved in cell wall biosynthesis